MEQIRCKWCAGFHQQGDEDWERCDSFMKVWGRDPLASWHEVAKAYKKATSLGLEMLLWRVEVGQHEPLVLHVVAQSAENAIKMVELSGRNQQRNRLGAMSHGAYGAYYAYYVANSPSPITKVEMVGPASDLIIDFGNVMEQPAEQGE